MSDIYHIVPWRNSEEWHWVYNEITDPLSSKEGVLEMLLVWKARAPSLPSGIESTLSLLQVQVEDSRNTNDPRNTNDHLIRLAYSSAIMRFVNHMLDRETSKGTSLYQAAKILGVPDWVIDLRHDTAHSNSLPSLKLLREACSISLQWLQKNYWDKYKEHIEDYTCGQNYVSHVQDSKIIILFNLYISLGICGHNKLNIKNISDMPDVKMRKSIIRDAMELLGDHVKLSDVKNASTLSLLTIINKHSKRFLKIQDVSSHVNEAMLGAESVFLSEDLLYFFSENYFNFKNKLYSNYVQCFEVLLTFLHTNEFLLDIILGLIKITQNKESKKFRAKLAALWVSKILVALKKTQMFQKKVKRITEKGKSLKETDLKQKYQHWFHSTTDYELTLDLQKPVPQDLQDVNFIQPIIAAYNPYLSYFIRNLLDLLNPPLPTAVVERICTLAELISSPHKFPVTSSSTIYTAEDLQNDDDVILVENEDIEEESKEHRDEEQIVNSIWRMASKEHEWSSCPVGQVPWNEPVNNIIEMETNQE